LDKKWLLYDTKQVLSLYSMSEVLQCELCGLSGLTCYKSVVEAKIHYIMFASTL